MVKKKRKKKIKYRSKSTYSDFVFKGLKDFGFVFVFFLIIAFFRSIGELMIWLGMSFFIIIGIFINAFSQYKDHLK